MGCLLWVGFGGCFLFFLGKSERGRDLSVGEVGVNFWFGVG